MRVCVNRWLVFCLMVCASLVHADAALVHQKEAEAFVRDLVQKDHFDQKQLRTILSAATYQPKIIASMQQPYEKKNWDAYQRLFLTSNRLNAGRVFWRDHQETLAKAERIYGVPAEIIVAIIGVETLYGKTQGNYRVLDALTTLAFYYPPRADYFKRELREYLLLCREHGVSATQYQGSYAGAMGQPQFMPSSYRVYAVDFAGRGRPNLMTNDHDAIMSVANYFQKHGWVSHQPVAERVHIFPDAVHRFHVNSKTPNYSITQLRHLGLKPKLPKFSAVTRAGVLELTTDQGPEYWLAYPNFYVITRYNTSPQYALVVYLLAESLRQQGRQA